MTKPLSPRPFAPSCASSGEASRAASYTAHAYGASLAVSDLRLCKCSAKCSTASKSPEIPYLSMVTGGEGGILTNGYPNGSSSCSRTTMAGLRHDLGHRSLAASTIRAKIFGDIPGLAQAKSSANRNQAEMRRRGASPSQV